LGEKALNAEAKGNHYVYLSSKCKKTRDTRGAEFFAPTRFPMFVVLVGCVLETNDHTTTTTTTGPLCWINLVHYQPYLVVAVAAACLVRLLVVALSFHYDHMGQAATFAVVVDHVVASIGAAAVVEAAIHGTVAAAVHAVYVVVAWVVVVAVFLIRLPEKTAVQTSALLVLAVAAPTEQVHRASNSVVAVEHWKNILEEVRVVIDDAAAAMMVVVAVRTEHTAVWDVDREACVVDAAAVAAESKDRHHRLLQHHPLT
jgi:hypothetical protein